MSDDPHRQPDTIDSATEYVELVTFALGDELYAVEFGRVDQLIEDPTIERFPRTNPAVRGVTHVGGEVTVVIDIETLFGVDTGALIRDDEPLQLLTVDRGDDRQAVGVRIPARTGITTVPMDAIDRADAAEHAPTAAPDDLVFAVVTPDEDSRSVPIYVFDIQRLVESAI